MQLRALFEVGVGELYWLNEVVAVGVLSNVDGGGGGGGGDVLVED